MNGWEQRGVEKAMGRAEGDEGERCLGRRKETAKGGGGECKVKEFADRFTHDDLAEREVREDQV